VYGGSIYGDLREITLILSQRTIKEMVFWKIDIGSK
jgi:hypothetical protein